MFIQYLVYVNRLYQQVVPHAAKESMMAAEGKPSLCYKGERLAFYSCHIHVCVYTCICVYVYDLQHTGICVYTCMCVQATYMYVCASYIHVCV